MPKKSCSFNILSDVTCATRGCDRKLKKRIVEKNLGRNKPLFCFSCHKDREGTKGHAMR